MWMLRRDADIRACELSVLPPNHHAGPHNLRQIINSFIFHPSVKMLTAIDFPPSPFYLYTMDSEILTLFSLISYYKNSPI